MSPAPLAPFSIPDLLFYRLADDIKQVSKLYAKASSGRDDRWETWARRFSLRVDRTKTYTLKIRAETDSLRDQKAQDLDFYIDKKNEDWFEAKRLQVWCSDAALLWLESEDNRVKMERREQARKECELMLVDVEEILRR